MIAVQKYWNLAKSLLNSNLLPTLLCNDFAVIFIICAVSQHNLIVSLNHFLIFNTFHFHYWMAMMAFLFNSHILLLPTHTWNEQSICKTSVLFVAVSPHIFVCLSVLSLFLQTSFTGNSTPAITFHSSNFIQFHRNGFFKLKYDWKFLNKDEFLMKALYNHTCLIWCYKSCDDIPVLWWFSINILMPPAYCMIQL